MNFIFNEIALSNKNGTAMYNYNSSFESSGSSLSSIYKNDTKWINSRKFILKIILIKLYEDRSYRFKKEISGRKNRNFKTN